MYSSKTEPKFRAGPIRVPDVRFAIVGNPRTGSSHLVSLLDSHPDIACWDGEIFDEGEAFDTSSYQDPQDFLRERVFKINAKAVGFKLLWNEMNRLSNVWRMLKTLDINLVHTYRGNLLDSFISYQLASTNHAFTSWQGVSGLYGVWKTNRFEADYDQCFEWFEKAEHCDVEIKRRSHEEGIPRVEIEYRELCENQDRVLDFLQVPRQPLTSRLKKQRKGSQSEIITNYAEIKKRFAGTKWAIYFEE